MSQSPNLRFPNGHTVEQVKRNAKRLSKEQGLPLNRALDQLACTALGLPENSIRWPEAIKALELTINYYRIPGTFSDPQEAMNAFTDGIVVSIDLKDAMEFKETGPWLLDEELKISMTPTIMALYAHRGAEEDGRKIPNQQDWDYAFDDLLDPTIYRYTGSSPFGDVVDVVRDICKRNFFPPDDVWMNGKLIEQPNEIKL